jgi:hypothetical protein
VQALLVIPAYSSVLDAPWEAAKCNNDPAADAAASSAPVLVVLASGSLLNGINCVICLKPNSLTSLYLTAFKYLNWACVNSS